MVFYYFAGQGIIIVGILIKVLTTSSIQTLSDICETSSVWNCYSFAHKS